MHSRPGFPVAKVLNAADYYVEPTADSVAVALMQAQINTDSASDEYLTQILDGVYNNADPRTYPLSSYSYMIVPTEVVASTLRPRDTPSARSRVTCCAKVSSRPRTSGTRPSR